MTHRGFTQDPAILNILGVMESLRKTVKILIRNYVFYKKGIIIPQSQEDVRMASKYLLKELSRYSIGTFADIIYRNALLHPNDEAFIYGDEVVTFSQYNARVNGLIKSLYDLGVKKGEILGLASWNCLEYMDVVGAAMKGGFIASPYNPKLNKNELLNLINYSEATVLFVGPENMETIRQLRAEDRLPTVKHFISLEGPADDFICNNDLVSQPAEEPEVDISEDDPYIIFYTSGTTALPKGAVYTHSRKIENTRIKAIDMAVEAGSRHLLVIPLFHTGGDSNTWMIFFVGGCNVISKERSFNAHAVSMAIEKHKITDMAMVPTQIVMIMNQQDIEKINLSSLKRLFYAGSAMPTKVLKKAIEIFGPIFTQGYGLTESGPHTCGLSIADHKVLNKGVEEQKILSSAGRPCAGIHMRIVNDKNEDTLPGEPGEIIIKHKSIMQEYWHKPVETSSTIIDGWLHSGDVGYYDEKGFIYIVDRKSDMIITGGENVFPREIEELLYTHPAVAEAAVIGVPDPVWVERIHAVISTKEGQTTTEEEIIEYCKGKISGFKRPKTVQIIDALPKNPQGKILKRELRAQFLND